MQPGAGVATGRAGEPIRLSKPERVARFPVLASPHAGALHHLRSLARVRRLRPVAGAGVSLGEFVLGAVLATGVVCGLMAARGRL